MTRTFSSTALSALVGAPLCLCIGAAAARAQDFPDPLKTHPAAPPARAEAPVFPEPGRGGFGRRPPKPFRVTVSGYFPDSRTITRGIGTLGSLDVEYDAFTSRFLGGPTVVGVFADFSAGQQYRRNQSAQFDASVIGVGLIARRVFTESLDRRHFYIGAGGGFYSAGLDVNPLGPERYKATSNSFGVRFQGGYQFTRNLYAQVDLLSLDLFRTRNADGRRVRVNPSGARLGVGIRF